jgi:hypothetical protein
MTIAEKFMDRVFILTEDKGCWLWVGSLSRNGRPAMKWQGESVVPARVSLTLYTGRNPRDLCALHTCDNEVCVRPEHLYWGTRADNGRDMSKRNRVVWDKGIFGQKGELAYNHRWTNTDVIEMRRLHWQVGESYAEIGRRFHTNSACVYYICTGKKWGHLKDGLPNPQGQPVRTTTQSELLLCIAVLSNQRNVLLRCAG